jgi:hypothetical protein
MGGFWEYFRVHKWERRGVTVLLVVVVAFSGALLLYPRVQRRLLLRDLRSDDPKLRRQGIDRAAAVGRKSPRGLRWLNEALVTDDDRLFSAVATALNRLGEFDTPQRDPVQIDRMRAIDLAVAGRSEHRDAAVPRGMILRELILCGRDNRYVRRAAATAAEDAEPAIRELAAVLAARLGDDRTLKKLLEDTDAGVVAAAALDAGLASRKGLSDSIFKLLETSEQMEVLSSSAYAMALLAPKESSPRLCALLKGTRDEHLRDRLLHVMTVLDDDRARAAVLEICKSAHEVGRHPSGMAMLAAGKLKIEQVGQQVLEVLAAAVAPKTKLRVPQVLAALQAADALDLPVRAEVDAICRKLWSPDYEQMMVAAARLLGEQIGITQGQAAQQLPREDAIETLRRAALYELRDTPPGASTPKAITTPMGSAAAAVALWMLDPQSSEYQPLRDANQEATVWLLEPDSSAAFVRSAARSERVAAGDFIAWSIARSEREEGFGLGLRMLPPLDAPAELREFNHNARNRYKPRRSELLLGWKAVGSEQKTAIVSSGRTKPRC